MSSFTLYGKTSSSALFSFQSAIRNLRRYPFLRPLSLLVGLGGLEPPTSRLSGVRSGLLSYKPLSIPGALDASGGDEENRTPDPLLARQVLSQLSYTPVSESYWALKIK